MPVAITIAVGSRTEMVAVLALVVVSIVVALANARGRR
jgi:hypothetical protein